MFGDHHDDHDDKSPAAHSIVWAVIVPLVVVMALWLLTRY